MQLSTSLFYDRAVTRMTLLGANATKLQTQIATGKKLQTPSENVVAAQQIAEFDRKDADAAAYAGNLTIGASLLKQADSTLDSIASQLGRAIELATQATTGTLGPANRKVIGNELNSIVDSLIGLANTRDVGGQPLFGSADGQAAAVRNADGTFTYNMTAKLSEIPIADGQTLQATETAGRIFTSSAGDTLKIISDLAAALQAGTELSDDDKGALDKLTAASDQVGVVAASVGARAARVELQQTLLSNANADRAELRTSIEDVDITEAITQLQKTLTILSATQASFSKLSNLSLFDYLR